MPVPETQVLAGGAALVMLPIVGVNSVALTCLMPGGSAYDAEESDGTAAMLSELMLRGAGSLNSRQLSDALDRASAQRSCDVSAWHLQLAMAVTRSNLDAALGLFGLILREARLPADAVDPARSLCEQALEGIEDDPQSEVMLRLRERHADAPYHRHGYGSLRGLRGATASSLRRAWSQRVVPGGTIIGLAGAIDTALVAQRLRTNLGDWSGTAAEPPTTAPAPRGYLPIEREGAQVHIAAAWNAPRERDDDSVLERLAVAILSGSSSSRLFTEVRQKRSLCYTVHAGYRPSRDHGRVTFYAGTTPQRAQETLDVSLEQMEVLRAGVTGEEFERARTLMRSGLIMQSESVPAQAALLAADYFRLGRARALSELADRLQKVTLEQLNGYLARRRFEGYTLVTIGPAVLESRHSAAAGASVSASA